MPKRARDHEVLHEKVPGNPRPTANAASFLLFALFPDAVPPNAYEHVPDGDRHYIYAEPKTMDNAVITAGLLEAARPAGACVRYVFDGRPYFLVRPEQTARKMPAAATPAALGLPAADTAGDDALSPAVLDAAARARSMLVHTEAPRYDDFGLTVARAADQFDTVELRLARRQQPVARLEWSELGRALAALDVAVRVRCAPDAISLLVSGRRRIAPRA